MLFKIIGFWEEEEGRNCLKVLLLIWHKFIFNFGGTLLFENQQISTKRERLLFGVVFLVIIYLPVER